MRLSLLIFTFLFLNITLFADEKWIPIEPINPEKKSEIEEKSEKKIALSEIEIPQLNKAKILLDGAKVLLPLIDKRTETQMPDSDSKKNWYVLENMETN